MTVPLLDRVENLCTTADRLTTGHALARDVAELRSRLHEPLRVAIAGRVKAGKSTLLNALVGERLAPTDTGECTRIVTWYREAIGYGVSAHLTDETEVELRFRRSDGELSVELDELAPAAIERLEVRWPSTRLNRMTLVDTPGLEGMDEQSAERTLRFLGLEDEGRSDVDAVVYLMRHMHHRDAEFLEAFMDRSLSRPSPVNAIAVLSRADEIGGGRLDSLDSAQAIAGRYAEDERVRTLCSTVVPVAGLIAETGATLTENETASLQVLLTMPATELASMLLSVDRFCDGAVSPLPSQARRDLLARFGLFGIRYCLTEMQAGRVETAADLSNSLVAASGIRAVSALLDEHFASRARVLKARSVLIGLKDIAARLSDHDADAARALATSVEELETSAHELAELRLWHLVVSGAVELEEEERAEVQRVTAEGDPPTRMGLDAETDSAVLLDSARERVDHWRNRGSHPLTNRDLQEVCETLARSYEGIYAEATRNAAPSS